MMARLVALIGSIRPTVRRVTRMLATPASTNISSDARDHGGLDLVGKAVEIADIPSHQQTIAARKCFEHRPQQRPVCRIGQRLAARETRSIRWLP